MTGLRGPRWTTAIAVAVAVASASGRAAAQETEPLRKEATLSFALMLPHGDFREALDTLPFGGSFHALIGLRSTPLSLGGDTQLLWYGESRDMIATMHGLVRLQARAGARRPYADALVGVRSFSVYNQITYSYGAGVGLQFELREGPPGMQPGREVIDVGVRYFRGGAADVYFRKRSPHTNALQLQVGVGFRF